MTVKAASFIDPATGIIFDTSTGTIQGYSGSEPDLVIPYSIDGVNVTSIDGIAFNDCSSLVSISIPAGVTSIGNQPFYQCNNLTDIIVSSDNSSYSSDNGVLFNKDMSILLQYPTGQKQSSYTIPYGVTRVSSGAFALNTYLTDVQISDSVASLGIEGYHDCGDCGPFAGCTNLENVSFGLALQTIGIGAFSGCTKLTDITLPDSVTGISVDAFDGCTTLKTITIPNSVINIGDGAFNNCPNLTVFGGSGSLAQIYANANSINFDKTVNQIVMDENPLNTTYILGQSLDITGADIATTYYNESTANIPVTSDMVSGYDANTPGEQNVTVSYGGQTTTFPVMVIDNAPTSIAMATDPSTITYIQGQNLNLAGAQITITFDNNITVNAPVTSDMVSGYDANFVGQHVFCNRKMLRIAKINAQAKVSIFAGKPKEKTE